MTNLLTETLETLREHGIKEEEIDWVGTRDGKYVATWEEFKEIAKDINYDNGYGAYYIALDLVIVLKNGCWLERQEYDGAEWWELKCVPRKQKHFQKLNKKIVFGGEDDG